MAMGRLHGGSAASARQSWRRSRVL